LACILNAFLKESLDHRKPYRNVSPFTALGGGQRQW